MAAASIEVIIRARDEASAAVSASLRKITTDAKSAQDAVSSIGTGGTAGKQATAAMGELIKSMDAGTESTSKMIGSLSSMVGLLGGPWGAALSLAGTGIAAYMDSLERARKEQEAFNKEIAKFAAVAEQAQAQRLGIAAERAEAAGRQARAAGDATGLAEAERQVTAALQQRYELQKKAIDDAEIARRKEITEKGREVPQEVTQAFDQQRALLADKRAQDDAKREEARARQVEQLERQQEQAERARIQAEERAAQRRLQYQVAAIEGAAAIEAATARATARRDAAEAQRLGTIEQVTQAQIAGILRVRDIELQAIRDRANAQAAGARGPTREDDVLAIRRREEQETALKRIAADDAVAQVNERALARRQQQEEQLRAIQRQLGEITTEQELARQEAIIQGAERYSQAWLTAYQQIAALQQQLRADAQAALADLERNLQEKKQPGRSAADLATAGVEADIALRKARVAAEVFAQGGTVTPEELAAIKNIPQLERNARQTPDSLLRATLGQRPEIPNTQGLGDNLKEANENARELTEQIKRLGAAVKEVQTEPGFAAKLSQDLADTLEFLSGRHP